MTHHPASVRVHYPAASRVYLALCPVCGQEREFTTRAEAQAALDTHSATHTSAA